MSRTHLLVTAQQDGTARTEQLEGREHLVFPAVLVKQQVLHNNLGASFLPFEEIEFSASDWNDVAVVVRHPEKEGQAISARSPDVLNSVRVGRLYNARAEDGKLLAEVWIDMARVDDVEDTDAVLNTVNEGKPAELSTGFAAAVENVEGEHDGETYEMVLRDIRPDHLALLPDEIGACSVADGCGLARNKGESMDEDVAETVAETVWTRLKALVIGQAELSLDDIREMVHEAAESRWGGTNIWTWVDELFDDYAVISVEPQGEGQTYYRVDYTVDETERSVELAAEATEVEKVTEFVPAENGRIEARHTYLATSEEETDMDREELLNTLCDCDRVAFRRETLEAMTDEELAHVATQAEAVNDEPEAETAEPVAAETEETVEEEAETVEAENKAPEWFTEFADGITARLSKLEEDTEPARNQVAEERKALIEKIAANTDFEADELEDKPLVELKKLGKAVAKPRNYAGLGGPRLSDPSKTDLGFPVHSTLGTGPGETITNRKEN